MSPPRISLRLPRVPDLKAEVNGTVLCFDVQGEGLVPDGSRMRETVPCFVLHGGPALDHTYFKPWLSPLTDVFQLLYVHRGTGRSGKTPPETYRLAVMADEPEALCDHLGLERVAVMGQFVWRHDRADLRA